MRGPGSGLKKWGWLSMVGLALVLSLSGCTIIVGPSQSHQGTVFFFWFEGGFYGIITDTGEKFDPLNLPSELAVDGLRVKFDGQERPDKGSLHMWGIVFEITKIERL